MVLCSRKALSTSILVGKAIILWKVAAVLAELNVFEFSCDES
ncbi:hypothetical protein tinsulaeT_28610 [Thalassotalea insulae]|uniref:Uncharacterized protein n=1 Tax=Thalassotalea insulae TaxID=2056778 RepID=A0ABQ6GZ77_9GAMM|nr:hypothetical protein tinsulaeT_28610 [Thalassotalea insulae]